MYKQFDKFEHHWGGIFFVNIHVKLHHSCIFQKLFVNSVLSRNSS